MVRLKIVFPDQNSINCFVLNMHYNTVSVVCPMRPMLGSSAGNMLYILRISFNLGATSLQGFSKLMMVPGIDALVTILSGTLNDREDEERVHECWKGGEVCTEVSIVPRQ